MRLQIHFWSRGWKAVPRIHMKLVCPLSVPETQEIFCVRFLSFSSFFYIPSFSSTFPPLLFTFLHAVLCFSFLFASEDDADFSAVQLIILQFPLHLVPSWSWSPQLFKTEKTSRCSYLDTGVSVLYARLYNLGWGANHSKQ